MATTFAGALASGEGLDWGYYFTIDGVPHVFGHDPAATAVLEPDSGRIHLDVLTEPPEVTRSTIDYGERRVVGGTFGAKLVDDGGVLEGLFTPRARPVTWVNDAFAIGDGAMSINDSTDIAEPSVVYVDAETIAVSEIDNSGVGGGPAIIGTFGAFGSEEQDHLGEVELGAGVYLAPPSWAGRRLRAYAYLMDRQGRVTTDRRFLLGVWRVRTCPTSLGRQQWRVETEPLIDDFWKRKVGDGLGEDDASYARNVIEAIGTGDIIAAPAGYSTKALAVARANFADAATRFSYALVRYEGDAFDVLPFVNAGTVDTLTYLYLGEASRAVGGERPRRTSAPQSAKHICILEGGDAAVLLFFLLASRLGDSANGPYDVLPGVAAAGYAKPGYRMGAGISEDEIDFDGIRDAVATAPPWSLVIDDSIPLGDILADFALLTGTIVAVTREGKLTLKPLAESVAASQATLTELDFREETLVSYDEAGIAPRLRLKCNYNAVTQDFEGTVEIIDEELVRRYQGREEAIELESRLLQIAPSTVGSDGAVTLSATVSIGEIEPALRRYQVSNGRGRCLLERVGTLDSLCTLEIGDVVNIDFDAPDLAGGNVRGQQGRVVSHEPRLREGIVNVTFEVIEKLYAIAPVGIVSSWNAGTLELTLSSTAPENGGSTTPGFFFAVGQELYLYDVSTDTIDIVNVVYLEDDIVQLAGTPAFTPVAGDFLMIENDAWTATQLPNASGFTERDYAYLQPPEGEDELTTRWR